jgi:hypothetical protein
MKLVLRVIGTGLILLGFGGCAVRELTDLLTDGQGLAFGGTFVIGLLVLLGSRSAKQ